MGTLERLGPTAVRGTIVSFRDALASHVALLNRLNVYPVPDGDTGTNMARTVDAVVVELESTPAGMRATCEAISQASLMGARGNSGVILSQILRGLVAGFDSDEVTAKELADGLRNGAAAAYRAVLRPVEGTILTVVREAANAAERAVEAGGTLLGVLEAAREAGQVALNRTPELLPVLREAGVVDAGGAGFLLLLDAALHQVAGLPLPVPEAIDDDAPRRVAALGTRRGIDQSYEVMYLLDLQDERIDDFRAAWGAIGDSIVVVGGDGVWSCHIHTDDVGAAVEAALDSGGRPSQIRVTDLRAQVDDLHAAHDAELQRPAAPVGVVVTGVVAVAVGAGLATLFRERGAERVVAGGQTMNPSTAELLAAADGIAADEVVLLPNNTNIVAVANQVDLLSTKTVRTVPTVAAAQGLLVLEAYDAQLTADENHAAMTALAAEVRSGSITCAVRASSCELGPIREGQWLGMVDGAGIVGIADEPGGAAVAVLDALLRRSAPVAPPPVAPARLVVLAGVEATDPVTRTLRAWLDAHHGGLQVEVHDGGQPLYPYLFATR